MFSFLSWGLLKITCRWATQLRAKLYLCSLLQYFLHFLKALQPIKKFLISFFFSGSVVFQSYFTGLYKGHNLVFIIILVFVNEQWSRIWTLSQMLFSSLALNQSLVVTWSWTWTSKICSMLKNMGSSSYPTRNCESWLSKTEIFFFKLDSF